MRPLKTTRLFALVLSFLSVFGRNALAQEKPGLPERSDTSPKKIPSAKSQTQAASEKHSPSAFPVEHEDSDLIRKRAEWFYKQRSSVGGHIPAGARLKALQHMQRMMMAEGKLERRPDGSYAAATPLVGPAVGGRWSALGPTPTSGGFFSPVSGRIEAIAADPSDPSGNTVLIGGAQGGIWRSTDAGATWTAVGDQNASLAMGSIDFAPSNPSIVYAGTGEQAAIGFDVYYGAGVLKSTDHGQTWTQTCTMASTTCPFIGPFTNTLNFGFFNDGGARISYVAVNPSNPNLLLVAAQIPRVGGTASETSGGIYCSSDGGVTWIPLLSGEAGSFVGFATASIAYAALGRPSGTATGATNPNGIYKSTNASAASCSAISFGPVAQQPTTQSMGRIDLGIAPSDTSGNTVYASTADGAEGSHTNLGVFVTTNGGASWTRTSAPDVCRNQCWYDNVIKVDPANANIAFLGGAAVANFPPPPTPSTFEWVMRSTNGGATWSAAIPTPTAPGDPTLPHVDEHAMAFVKLPSGTMRLYLGNDGGLWRTDDAEAATVTWTNLNQNLTLTQFYPNLSVNPSNPTIAYGGAQDNGSQLFQGNPNWTDNRNCGDGGQTAVDFQIPTSVYITCQFIALLFSPTGGTDPTSFIFMGNGIDPNGTDAVDFIPPIATDPSTPGRVYFGTDHVYQSNDNGNTFTAISGALPTREKNYLTAFGVSPTNPAVVYAGANDGDIFVATNVAAGSATFSQVAGQTQHPLRNVTALAVAPNDATGNTVYAAFSGFALAGQDTMGHIFVSMNGGVGWADVSCSVAGGCQNPAATDLPNIPVNDVVIDPDLPGTIYAATDIGVFQGTCTGTACSWNTLGAGLPNVAVLSLKLHEPSRTLVAATHGRGAWSLVLTNAPLPVGPHISSLSPISTPAGATTPLTLEVNGRGLTNGTVQWKAGSTTTALVTTVVSDSQVTAMVPTSLLAAGGPAQVFVSVAATNSNQLTFGVLFGLPTISGATPGSAPVNTATAQTIIVTGTNFSTNSQVMLNPDFPPGNGQPNGRVLIPTTVQSSTQLTATIPASFLANFGSTNSVGVHTPPPGGGTTLSPPPTGTGATPLPTFTIVAPAPQNDNFANAIAITGNSFTDTKDSSAATTETADPSPPCVSGSSTGGRSNSVWYKFSPASGGTANLDTSGSNYDTVLSIWTGSAGSLVSVACNNGIVGPGIVFVTELRNVNLTAGTTYYIMVSSFGPPDPNPVALGGKSVLNFSFTPPPDFLIAATGTTTQTINAGQAATFTNAITVTAQNGFASQVNLSCALPVAATFTTCAVNPNMLANGNGTASVSVTTMAHGSAPPLVPLGRFYSQLKWVPVLMVTLWLAIVLLRFARTRWQRLAAALPLAVVLLLLLLQAMGCGGVSSGPPPPTGTPAGTYTITVTGTSGSTTHTTTLILTVN